jgi:hypothetical protein
VSEHNHHRRYYRAVKVSAKAKAKAHRRLQEILTRQCSWETCPCRKRHDELLAQRKYVSEMTWPEFLDYGLVVFSVLSCKATHPNDPAVRRAAVNELHYHQGRVWAQLLNAVDEAEAEESRRWLN